MKKEEVFNLYQSLDKVGHLKGVDFVYAVAKNKQILQKEWFSLNEAIKGSDDFIEHEQERIKLCEKYAKKDERGQSIKINNKYIFDDFTSFEKEYGGLREKDKKIIEEREKQLKDFDKILKQEVSVKLFKINKKYIPKEITGDELSSIFKIIQ